MPNEKHTQLDLTDPSLGLTEEQQVQVQEALNMDMDKFVDEYAFPADFHLSTAQMFAKYRDAAGILKYAHAQKIREIFGLDELENPRLLPNSFDKALEGASMEELMKTPNYNALSDAEKKVFPIFYEAMLKDKEELEANRERVGKLFDKIPEYNYDSVEAQNAMKKLFTKDEYGRFSRDPEEKKRITEERKEIRELFKKLAARDVLSGANTGIRYANILLTKPGLKEEERRAIISEAQEEPLDKLLKRYRDELLGAPDYVLQPVTDEQYTAHFDEFEYYSLLAMDAQTMLSHNPNFMTAAERDLFKDYYNGPFAQRNVHHPSLECRMNPVFAEAKFENMSMAHMEKLVARANRDKSLARFATSYITITDSAARLAGDLEKARKAKILFMAKFAVGPKFNAIDPEKVLVDLGEKDPKLLPAEQIADAFQSLENDARVSTGNAACPLELGEKTRYFGEYLKELNRLRASEEKLRRVSAAELDHLLAVLDRAKKDLAAGTDPRYAKMGKIMDLDRKILEAVKADAEAHGELIFDKAVLAAKQQILKSAPAVQGQDPHAAEKKRVETAEKEYERTLGGADRQPGLRDAEITRISTQLKELDNESRKAVISLERRMDQILAAPSLINSSQFKHMRDTFLGIAGGRPASYQELADRMKQLADAASAYMNEKDRKFFSSKLVDEKDRGKRISDAGKLRYEFAFDANRMANEVLKRLNGLKKDLAREFTEKGGQQSADAVWAQVNHTAGERLNAERITGMKKRLAGEIDARARQFSQEPQAGAFLPQEQMREFARYITAGQLLEKGREAEADRINENTFNERAAILQQSAAMQLMAQALEGKVLNLEDMKKCLKAAKEHAAEIRQFDEMDEESLEKCLNDLERSKGSMVHKTKIEAFDSSVLEIKQNKAREILKTRRAWRQEACSTAISDLQVPSGNFTGFAAQIRSMVRLTGKEDSRFKIAENAIGTAVICSLLNQGKDIREIMQPGRLEAEKREAAEKAYRLMTGGSALIGAREIGKIFAPGLKIMSREAARIEASADITKPGFMNTAEGIRLRFLTDAMADISEQIEAATVFGNGPDRVNTLFDGMQEALKDPDAGVRKAEAGAELQGYLDHGKKLKNLADHQQAVSDALGNFGRKGNDRSALVKAFAAIPALHLSAEQQQSLEENNDLVLLASELTSLNREDELAMVVPFIQDGSLAPLFKLNKPNPETGAVSFKTVPTSDQVIKYVKEQKKQLRAAADRGVNEMQALKEEVRYSYARDSVNDALAAVKQLRDRYAVKDVIITERTQTELCSLMETALKGRYMAECVKQNVPKDAAETGFGILKDSLAYRELIRTANTGNLASYLGNGGLRKTLMGLFHEKEPEIRALAQQNHIQNPAAQQDQPQLNA